MLLSSQPIRAVHNRSRRGRRPPGRGGRVVVRLCVATATPHQEKADHAENPPGERGNLLGESGFTLRSYKLQIL